MVVLVKLFITMFTSTNSKGIPKPAHKVSFDVITASFSAVNTVA